MQMNRTNEMGIWKRNEEKRKERLGINDPLRSRKRSPLFDSFDLNGKF